LAQKGGWMGPKLFQTVEPAAPTSMPVPMEEQGQEGPFTVHQRRSEQPRLGTLFQGWGSHAHADKTCRATLGGEFEEHTRSHSPCCTKQLPLAGFAHVCTHRAHAYTSSIHACAAAHAHAHAMAQAMIRRRAGTHAGAWHARWIRKQESPTLQIVVLGSSSACRGREGCPLSLVIPLQPPPNGYWEQTSFASPCSLPGRSLWTSPPLSMMAADHAGVPRPRRRFPRRGQPVPRAAAACVAQIGAAAPAGSDRADSMLVACSMPFCSAIRAGRESCTLPAVHRA